MKRSKIFLGATTALLAIAGVAAAKHFSPARTAFYLTSNGNWCTSALMPITQTGSQQYQYETSLFNTPTPAFTDGPGVKANFCKSPLSTNGVE